MIASSPYEPADWRAGLLGGMLDGNPDNASPNPGNLGMSLSPEAALRQFHGNEGTPCSTASES